MQKKKELLTLTETAIEKMKSLLIKKPGHCIRIGIKNGGCGGMEYTMETTKTPSGNDEHIHIAGIDILIDARAVLYLIGAEIDYKITELSSRFIFNNPNQIDACGCGESVVLKRHE